MDPRQNATELLSFAGLSETGRPFSDPVYKAITEGRQDRAVRAKQFYSSCGDLAHWLFFRMGVRMPFINRDELDGWSFMGTNNNITTLYTHPNGKHPGLDAKFEAGDVLIVAATNVNKTHVICVIDHDPNTNILHSAEYGQPHGALRTRHIIKNMDSHKLYIGDRSIDVHLPIYDVLNSAAAANKLVEPITAYEYGLQFKA
jgi:hypothetical protein